MNNGEIPVGGEQLPPDEQLIPYDKAFEDMWACRETIRDGEAEYGCEFLVKAKSEEEAERMAWEYVKRNWVYDCADGDEHPYTDYLNDHGWMESDTDYRHFKARVCRPIKSLHELLNFIEYVIV
ncbi:MAG: hypothetical protein KAR06_02765 [Deltaproteobacteria bacterium]|nr:hypothetical protein [Deltaproteobacteria bacterium]